MAEAFVVLGIAANIAQFIDYGLQLLSDGQEIYNSLHGARDEHHELETIIEDIRNFNEDSKPYSGQTSDDKALWKLAAECEPLASKLLGILSDLKVPTDARFRGLRTVKQTIRSSVKKREIQDLKQRLLELDKRLRIRASQILQKNNHSGVMAAIDALSQPDERLKSNIASELDRLRIDLLETLNVQVKSNIQSHRDGLETLSRQLLSFLEEGKRVKHQQQILKSLVFEEMKQREEAIKDAHDMTLNWIFERPETDFVNWLEAENGFYWVRGKAGSGKSTLMKYICAHETTLKILRLWAGSRNLVTASFFFWNAGLPMQKSKLGLLQSLLYQILLTCPSRLLELYPKRPNEPWSQKELSEALEIVSKGSDISSKFCFFVDGLDEYEGDDEDIVHLLQSLANSPNVKICVSSRPWNVFLDAFNNCRWKLVLEDLTRDDMRKYVYDMLVENEVFKKIAEEDSRCLTLVPRIVEKAQGVWLWVYLVVRDILRDLKGEEEFSFLQRRLDSFPEELEKFFANIIDKIDKIHREESARIFLVAVEAIGPIPAIGLRFLGMEQRNPKYALEMEITPMFEEQARIIAKQWEKLLNSRCRDLLELTDKRSFGFGSPVLQYQVGFLHRTVRDFLRENYQSELHKRAGHQFDATSSLCSMWLSVIKRHRVPTPDPGYFFEIRDKFEKEMLGLIENLLWYAREMERKGISDIELLDELDRVLTFLDDEIRELCGHKGHWTNMRKERTDEGGSLEENGNCNFMTLAIQEGFHFYVDQKLNQHPALLLTKKGRPLLDYVLRPTKKVFGRSRIKSQQDYRYVDKKMLACLLSHGADPNQARPFHEGNSPKTVWAAFLIDCSLYRKQGAVPERVEDSWYEACKMLIDHGAEMSTDPWVASSTILDGYANQLRELRMSSVSSIREIFDVEKADNLLKRGVQPSEQGPPKQGQPSIIRRLLGWT